jgi:uncharacterized protein YjbI with pentapeptide repeats
MNWGVKNKASLFFLFVVFSILGCQEESAEERLCGVASDYLASCYYAETISIQDCNTEFAEYLLTIDCEQIKAYALDPALADDWKTTWEWIKSVFSACDFTGSFSDLDELRATNICPGCDLRGACLSRANLSAADLSGAILEHAVLSWADLSAANLAQANLKNADLHKSNLALADMSGAQASGAGMSMADMSSADLIGVDLSGADLIGANLKRANLIEADLRLANLTDADLSEANLSSANIDGATWINGEILCEVGDNDALDTCICSLDSIAGECLLN